MAEFPRQTIRRPEESPGSLADLRGIPLGRWGGVRVGAHWSTLFTLVLLAVLLAGSVLPTVRPEESPATYWVAGSVTAVLFLACLLAHELAHALTARHFGLPVRSITLWMLGGVTDLGDNPPATPRADALTSGAGPATSLGLGVALYEVALWLPDGVAASSLAWLGSVNVLLAAFNLLPGAPLDGGGLLRAALWAHYGDRTRAAAMTSRAGRALGTGLLVLGLLSFVLGDVFGLWLAMLGWFISAAATSEGAAWRTASLRGVRAGEIMTPVALAVPEWWTVEQSLRQLSPAAVAQPVFPLIDFTGRPTGVLTLHDLANVPPARRDDLRVREIVRHRLSPLLVDPAADVAELAPQVPRHGGVAVVVEDQRPIGVITAAELTRAGQLVGLGWRASADASR